MIRFGLIFLTIALTIGVNLSEGFLARMGLNADILLVGLIAFVVTGLIYHRHMALVVLVALMAVGANLPTETITAYGYDPDYLLAGLIALVLLPFVRDL